MNKLTHKGYGAGHPWYYLLGGEIPRVKSIHAHVKASGYRSYLEQEIERLHAKAEPDRSTELARFREKVTSEIRADISRYRECARELRAHRLSGAPQDMTVCSDVHTAISLKFCHLVNGFAHLQALDARPQQGDLFEMM